MLFLAIQAKKSQSFWLKSQPLFTQVQFDDLETFEHTKCKPITVCMIVNKCNRKIIDFEIAEIPAKGHLAKIARKKYGQRPNNGGKARHRLFKRAKSWIDPKAEFCSDESPMYPKVLKLHFPKSHHIGFKGIRGCVTGQGELKKTAYDPLFSINHTFAMLRANINRLIRKTWCTSKKMIYLKAHIDIYVDFHNQILTK
jgi:hypothetical protein